MLHLFQILLVICLIMSVKETKALDTAIKKENVFCGQFYWRTRPITYSSAHITTLSLKSADLGTIIGEPIGQRIDFTGENTSFT